MDDKEMLKLAAKAIGEQCEYFGGRNYGVFKPKPNVMQPYVLWNPLDDDGDALRLAARLKLNIVQGDFSLGVNEEADIDEVGFVPHDDLRTGILRRAIVRAAAAIGERMK